MGIWENMKARRQAKKVAEINAEIEKIEAKKQKTLSEKGREKVTKKVKRKRGIRGALIAIAAALGIGGVANYATHELLPEGKEQEKQETTQKNEITTNSKKESYLKELHVDVDSNAINKAETSQEEEKDTQLIDQILEAYNANLLEQAKITKDDLGIIWQKDFENSPMKLIRETDENGEISYIENISKKTPDLTPDQEWAEQEKVGDIYVLVDTEKNATVAGIGSIEQNYVDNYYEINIENIRGENGIHYIQNPNTYVGIPEDIDRNNTDDMENAYKNFSNYYQERVNQLAEKEAQIEDDGSR